MTHQRLCEAHDRGSDAAGVHDLAREDEKRYGKQREAVDAVVEAREQGREVLHLAIEQQTQPGTEQQCKHHRRAKGEQQYKDPEEGDRHGSALRILLQHRHDADQHANLTHAAQFQQQSGADLERHQPQGRQRERND